MIITNLFINMTVCKVEQGERSVRRNPCCLGGLEGRQVRQGLSLKLLVSRQRLATVCFRSRNKLRILKKAGRSCKRYRVQKNKWKL